MHVSLIVAVSSNNVIGKDNKLPWHLPADLKYFKNTTWAMPIIMGRKTFESIGKPLPGRTNIVITRNKDWKAEGAEVVHSIDEARKLAEQHDVKEIFIIGGAGIFNSSIDQATRIYLTRVHHEFEGDAFFPNPDAQWQLVNNKEVEADEKNAYALSFEVWERKAGGRK